MDITVKTKIPFLGKLLLMVAFAVSYRQEPLYCSNQNTYFLHGLTRAGMGFLEFDWLSQTTDPYPVFSALVWLTKCALNEQAFYCLYIAILAIYGYSVVGISCYVCKIGSESVGYLSYLAVVTAWHSGALAHQLSKLPILSRISWITEPSGPLLSGVAEQYVLGSVFQPFNFGIFLILSIYLFLQEKYYWAVVNLAIASTFHPTYLLSSVILICIYLGFAIGNGNGCRKSVWLGAMASSLLTPTVAYCYANFRPTNPDVYYQAQEILVNVRIPHHAMVSNWFDRTTCFQIAIVMVSIFVTRRERIGKVLLGTFLASVISTTVQIITGNHGLALLFPWRLSVFIVPISSSILIGYLVFGALRTLTTTWPALARPILAADILIILILAGIGLNHLHTIPISSDLGHTPATRFVAANFQTGQVYLIPPEMESFRLAAGVPIVVDEKSHPYKDIEVIEWFERLRMAMDYYDSRGEEACQALTRLRGKYGITHVVGKSESVIADCGMLHEIYRDSEMVISEVRGR